MLIKYVHVLICICVGEGSWHFSAISLQHNLEKYKTLFGEVDVSGSEWHRYVSVKISDLPKDLNLTEWWLAQASYLPTLSKIAIPLIWIPIASCEVERSFSQYGDILSSD